MSDNSVFHEGELLVQNKLGVAEDVAKFVYRFMCFETHAASA